MDAKNAEVNKENEDVLHNPAEEANRSLCPESLSYKSPQVFRYIKNGDKQMSTTKMKIILICFELRVSSRATSLRVLQTIATPCQLDADATLEWTRQNFFLE